MLGWNCFSSDRQVPHPSARNLYTGEVASHSMKESLPLKSNSNHGTHSQQRRIHRPFNTDIKVKVEELPIHLPTLDYVKTEIEIEQHELPCFDSMKEEPEELDVPSQLTQESESTPVEGLAYAVSFCVNENDDRSWSVPHKTPDAGSSNTLSTDVGPGRDNEPVFLIDRNISKRRGLQTSKTPLTTRIPPSTTEYEINGHSQSRYNPENMFKENRESQSDTTDFGIGGDNKPASLIDRNIGKLQTSKTPLARLPPSTIEYEINGNIQSRYNPKNMFKENNTDVGIGRDNQRLSLIDRKIPKYQRELQISKTPLATRLPPNTTEISINGNSQSRYNPENMFKENRESYSDLGLELIPGPPKIFSRPFPSDCFFNGTSYGQPNTWRKSGFPGNQQCHSVELPFSRHKSLPSSVENVYNKRFCGNVQTPICSRNTSQVTTALRKTVSLVDTKIKNVQALEKTHKAFTSAETPKTCLNKSDPKQLVLDNYLANIFEESDEELERCNKTNTKESSRTQKEVKATNDFRKSSDVLTAVSIETPEISEKSRRYPHRSRKNGQKRCCYGCSIKFHASSPEHRKKGFKS